MGRDIGRRFSRRGKTIPDGETCLYLGEDGEGSSEAEARGTRRFASDPQHKLRDNPGLGLPHRKGTEVTAATLSLRVQPFRLLTKAEAAHYCRRSVKKFEAQCPVPPLEMADGDRLWDVRDLDRWIDSLKKDFADDANAIVARLE
jgi:hypothetical protein